MKLIVANFTPFTMTGEVDLDGLSAHVQYMISAGVDGFAPTGTTGAFLYLSMREKLAIHKTVCDAAPSSFVLPCVWDPLPRNIVTLSRAAADAGASGVFLPPPLYHVVSEDDILRWYDVVVNSTDIDVYAYHHPRTHNPLSVSLLSRLFDNTGVAGVKDSSGDIKRVSSLANKWPKKVMSSDHFFGLQQQIGPIAGFISKFANIYPELSRKIIDGEAPLSDMARLDEPFKTGGKTPAYLRALGFHARAPLIGNPKVEVTPLSPHWRYTSAR